MTEVMTEDGRQRVVIEAVTPQIDCGRYPVKRVVGESIQVEADLFTDGHDRVAARVLWRHESDPEWHEEPMEPLVNDRWRGRFAATELGRYRFTLLAWVDRFRTWREDLAKRVDAGQDVSVDLHIGAELIAEFAAKTTGQPAKVLGAWAGTLAGQGPRAARIEAALDDELASLMYAHDPRRFARRFEPELEVLVEPQRARFSAWYEMFPRSAGAGGRHGTFRDVEARLPYVADLGFDVLYLPPIHPIGTTFRKGKNNTLDAGPEDVGSPWAIGSAEGGHKAIHPDLGTVADFERLVRAAADRGIQIALDVAFQVSPDHPYVRDHEEWFRKRPDGTIQYAENPPKKYQDIYPFEFETPAWAELWEELASVFEYWIARGVTIFRVDNPHTKSFAFWEWCIARIKSAHPEVLFLSEAFTRPKVMYRLAKLGFSQSYTYFPWRNGSRELTEYSLELTRTEVAEYFRPNHWPNTPDILTAYLQYGGRAAFGIRLILAATLAGNYGIYGPAFELVENRAVREGSEEYLDSEKYQLRDWDLERPESLRGLIRRMNEIRRANPALHGDRSLHFHATDNDALICYSKSSPGHDNCIIIIVNLDPHHAHSGWVDLSLAELGVGWDEPFQVHDLIGGEHYLWTGPRQFVKLDPFKVPAHVLLVKAARTETAFPSYY